MPRFRLTNDNYYSQEANRRYWSVSQYKSFRKCEAAAMAELNGEWVRPKSVALLQGSYIDSWFEGTLDEFCEENPEIYKKNGELRSEFQMVEDAIAYVKQDEMFLRYMAGKKQIIKTGTLFGARWKIKMDSYHPDKIVDLKYMRDMERIRGESFVRHWGYDLQLAIYNKIEGHDLATYLAVVTKQDPPDKAIIAVPRWRRQELLEEVEREMPRLIQVKAGKIPPRRCGCCPYCRATKKLTEPVDFDLVGMTPAEIDAALGFR